MTVRGTTEADDRAGCKDGLHYSDSESDREDASIVDPSLLSESECYV